MRRIFVWFTVIVLAFGVLPIPVKSESEGTMTGSGIAGDPYVIMTQEQLDDVRKDLTAHYRLGADIDASETAVSNDGQGFEPIGGDDGFTGVFDGAGYAIRNLTINRPSQDGVGLFGKIGAGGLVRNLTLEGGSVTGGNYTGAFAGTNRGTVENSRASADVRGYGMVGGLVGYEYGKISASYATGNVSGTNYVGGLAGRSDGTITESYATGNVNGGNNVGGLVGGSEGGQLNRSYFAGTVSGSGYNVGGLAGTVNGGAVSLSYNIGSVSGSHAVGGLVGITVYGYVGRSYSTGTVSADHGDVGGALGANNGAVMEYNYWDAETSGQSNGCGYNNDAYGVPCVADSLTTAQALGQANYSGFDFSADWFMVEGSTRPFLRSEWSQTVGNAHQLQLMAMDLTADYTLADNIDFGTTFSDDSRADMWATSAGEGAGFAPIGDSNAGAFVGQIDGKGHAIHDLIIDRPETGLIGLIGYLGEGGLVRGIGVEGGSIRGSFSSGGLVGDNRGGTVERSYSTADVSGGNNVGGLVGNMFPGVVRQSYATGDITGTNAVGGLVGRADLGSLVEDTYAIGSVTGNSEVGGLVGRHVGTITRAFAAGYVTGSGSSIGGLAGRDFSPASVITSGYYDAIASGQGDWGKGDGKSTAELKRQVVFDDWDFSDIWTIGEGMTYPTLRGIATNAGNDAAPPTIVNAAVSVDRPNLITVTFDEEIRMPSAGGFLVKADGVDITVHETVMVGTKAIEVTLDADADLLHALEIRLSYDSQIGSVGDLAGNRLFSVTEPVFWSPMIRVSMKTADDNDYQDGTWTNQPVTVSASVYDDSGDTELFYSLDSGKSWMTYTENIELRDDGVFTVDFKAVNSAGLETVERRTVKISKSGLSLTWSVLNADGSPYVSGDWTNQSVTISVYAETGASGISSISYTVDGGSVQAYDNRATIAFVQEGSHAIAFQLEDQAGNRLSEEILVKIDRTPPTVTFSPNGRSSSGTSATTRVRVEEVGSGIDAATLQYAWTTDPLAPAESWMPFVNGTELTKRGETGDWYLYVRAVDQAGNRTETASNPFRLGRQSSSWVPLPNNVYPIAPNGGTAKFEAGEISFPAGAMERPILVTINEITDTGNLPLSDKERLASRVVEVRKDVPGNFLDNVTVMLRLNSDVTQQEGVEILLCWLDEDTRQWVALANQQIDFEKSTISGTTNHFTKFAAIARTVDTSEPEEVVFTDIQGHWAEEIINHLAGNGAVSGYPDGTFRPDRSITRAEFVSILNAVLHWKPAGDKTFADTENHWARVAVSTAYANGAIRGYDDNTFAPDAPITREQMAVMAVNALQLKDPAVAPSYADGDLISRWAKDAVGAASEQGILSGYPDHTFKPQAQATRAEAVKVIAQMINIIESR